MLEQFLLNNERLERYYRLALRFVFMLSGEAFFYALWPGRLSCFSRISRRSGVPPRSRIAVTGADQSGLHARQPQAFPIVNAEVHA